MSRFAWRGARDRLFVALVVGALFETVWTVYLARQLPRHYVVNHWDLAWVGLDVGEIVMLVVSAWAAWFRRAVLIPSAVASATLLLLDAWFDVTTAGRDVTSSVVVAALVEVPAAITLLVIAQRATRRLFTSHDLGSMPVRRIPLSPPHEDSAERS